MLFFGNQTDPGGNSDDDVVLVENEDDPQPQTKKRKRAVFFNRVTGLAQYEKPQAGTLRSVREVAVFSQSAAFGGAARLPRTSQR